MKKIIAVLLCLVMLFSLSSVAFAAEASTADQIRGAVRQNILTSTKVVTTFAKEAAGKVADYAKDNQEAIGDVVGDTAAGMIAYGAAKNAELVKFGADTANAVVENTLNASANLPTEAVAAGAAAAAVAPVAGAAMAAALIPASLAAKTAAALTAAATPVGLAFLIPATQLVNGVLLRNSDLARSLAEKFAYPVERMIGSAIVKAQGMLADSVHKLDKIALAAINQNPALLNQPCTKAIKASQHMLAAALDRFDQFVIDFTDYTQPGLIVRPTPVHHHVAAPKTFDAGIALYVALGVMGVTGSAVVIGKKKEN